MAKISIGRNFGLLAQFSGRDGPGQFWPYAGLVIALFVVCWIVAFIPVMSIAMAKAQQIAAAHPDQAQVTVGPSGASVEVRGDHPELLGLFGTLLGVMACLLVLAVFLLAAAVTRRLHDRNMPGYWACLPLPFLAIGFTLMPRIFGQTLHGGAESLTPVFLLFANNMVYLAMLAVLVLLLVGRGTAGPNRFGAPPQ